MSAAPEETAAGASNGGASGSAPSTIAADSPAPLKRPSDMTPDERRQYDADVSLLKQKMRDLGSGFLTTRAEGGHVGLSNQGATCYLNSLLQTLFMLPAFRASVYAWRYDPARDGKEETCIPLQLQRLFARLQCSSRAAVSTKPVHALQNDSAA